MKKSALLVIGLGLSSLSVGQITQKGDSYTVTQKYKLGQVTTMTMSVVSKSTQSGVPNQTVKATLKVLKVTSNGNATLEISYPAFAGQPARKERMIVDKYGRPVDNNFGTFAGNFALPSYAIKIGDKWNGDLNMSAGGGASIPIKATYKFSGVKTVAGVKVAVVDAKLDMSSFLGMAGSGIMLIRFDDGQLYESALRMSMDSPNAKTQKNQRISMLVSVKNRR
jgi:hypothetical protein